MQEVALRNFRFFDVYLLTGIVYLLLVWVITIAARRLERVYVVPGLQQ